MKLFLVFVAALSPVCAGAFATFEADTKAGCEALRTGRLVEASEAIQRVQSGVLTEVKSKNPEVAQQVFMITVSPAVQGMAEASKEVVIEQCKKLLRELPVADARAVVETLLGVSQGIFGLRQRDRLATNRRGLYERSLQVAKAQPTFGNWHQTAMQACSDGLPEEGLAAFDEMRGLEDSPSAASYRSGFAMLYSNAAECALTLPKRSDIATRKWLLEYLRVIPAGSQYDSLPDMRVAKVLWDRGDKNIVAQYLEVCSQREWRGGVTRVREWLKEVRQGKWPRGVE